MHISFTIHETGLATIRVFDIAGRAVRGLFGGRIEAGSHLLTWDGRDQHGKTCASGIYFVSLTAAGKQTVRKVVYLN